MWAGLSILVAIGWSWAERYWEEQTTPKPELHVVGVADGALQLELREVVEDKLFYAYQVQPLAEGLPSTPRIFTRPTKALWGSDTQLWLLLERGPMLYDTGSNETVVEPEWIHATFPHLAFVQTLCEPARPGFDGPVELATGSVCIESWDHVPHLLSRSGELTKLPEANADPEEPCGDDQWRELDSRACLARVAAAEGGSALRSSSGWTSAAMINPRPVLSPGGHALRALDLSLVRHGHAWPFANTEQISAIDERGATVWSLSTAALGHTSEGLFVGLSGEQLVIASSLGERVHVTVHELRDGALVRESTVTFEDGIG